MSDSTTTICYVLWWRYSDGSGMEIMRVYSSHERAEQDWLLVRDSCTKDYALTQVPFFGGIQEGENDKL